MEFFEDSFGSGLKHIFDLEDKPFAIAGMGRTFSNPEFNTLARHRWNEFYNFEYITKGKGYIKIEDEVFTVTAGDFFFIHRSIKRHLFSDKKDPFEKLYLLVTGPFVDGIVQAYGLPSPFFSCKEPVYENFLKIIQLVEDAPEPTIELEEAVADELLKIVRTVSRENVKKKTATNLALRIKTSLEWNISNKYTIDDLSNALFLGKTKIIKAFKSHYGVTPMKYLRDRRIELAKTYLSDTDIPIQRIHEMIGLCDERYFSSAFKAATGMSPREYRKAYKRTSR